LIEAQVYFAGIEENMSKQLQKSMSEFFVEAKQIPGAEDAILNASDEIRNGVILTGVVYGKGTIDKIEELGNKYRLLVLAQELTVLYEKPKG